MQDFFLIHNLFRSSLRRFKSDDPQLKKLKGLPYIYASPLIDQLQKAEPGIYTLSGGRQVGKSTLVKQVLLNLLEKGNVPGQNIYYVTGELIGTHHDLLNVIQEFLTEETINKKFKTYLFIDETTYIDFWEKGIKFLADSGQIDNTVILLTGSDAIFLKETVKTFPGRRGGAAETDFHYYPLSFLEVLLLKKSMARVKLENLLTDDSQNPIAEKDIETLYAELQNYLITGGYLTAINDQALHGTISHHVYKTYSDWIKGDILKRGKQENYLDEILTALVKKSGSQVTWNSLASELSIDHHKTVADYIEILSNMDAVFIQSALREDMLTGAPKKAKKIHFSDPFVTRSICQIMGLAVPDDSLLVESALVTHVRRNYSTYYIKNKGEIDIAYVQDRQIFPIEVKWTASLRPEYFKILKKYHGAVLGAKIKQKSEVRGVKTFPLPILFLMYS